MALIHSLMPHKQTFVAVLSTCLAVMCGAVSAHEVRPAISDLTVSADRILLEFEASAEAMVAGIDLSTYTDTNDAPEAAEYERLRGLLPPTLAAEIRQAWPELSQGLDLRAGDTRLEPVLEAVEVPFEDDADLARDTKFTLSAVLPADASAITVGWVPAFGALVVRQVGGGDDAYTAYLEPGARSEAIPREGARIESAGEVFTKFIWQGVLHIVPKGLDHILIELGLFFFSLHVRPLLWQISAFTLAHTVTLGLASFGLVTVAPAIVEPLIAASIVYVAVENIIRPQLGWWRVALVFGFGLLHGLGFASVLSELALSPARLVVGLIGFNIGVELGQLTVIAAAFLSVGLWFGAKPWYRKAIAIPASLVIAVIGSYWVVERTLL
jgi:hypothetical protein